MTNTDAVPERRRGLTLRSFVVCLVSLLLMAIWIEYEELYNTYGGPLAENSPPNSAVGVITAVMLIGGGLFYFRRGLRLCAAELVVIYAALVLAAPLMTQGMWHRIIGLTTAIPHNQDFKSYESLPPMLWPHGPNVLANGRFVRGLDGCTFSGGGEIVWENMDRGGKGVWKSPVLSNAGRPGANATLSFAIDRYDARGRETLVPGGKFLFSMLVRTADFSKDSAYLVRMQADDQPPTPLLASAEETQPTFACPEGFQRVGVNPVMLPLGLQRRLTLRISLHGPGRLTLQDVQLMNVEAVEGLYSGRKAAREAAPGGLLSLAGWNFLATGYIPLRQWAGPALAWSLLVGALFMGFLGLNLLMRKQWVEHERFTFPLTIIPKQLFTDEGGRFILFRNRVFWLGFACALPFVLAKGLHFYHPEFPSLSGGNANFADYVTNPLLKAYFQNVTIGGERGLTFSLFAVALLIETDVLFALWSMFLIFQFWNFSGKAFNFTRYAGYPWESQQAMGAFIAYALLALVVARQHLWRVLKLVLGRGAPSGGVREETVTYRWAFVMVAAALLMLLLWGVWTRMGAAASLLFFGYILVCGFAASKIRAEMGAPWSYMTPYYGLQFVAAVGGFAIFHSTGMLVATIAAGFMCPTCFLLMAPAQVEMMELGRHFDVRPGHIRAGLCLGLLGGVFLGGFVVLCWAYGFGADNLATSWPYEQDWYFSGYRTGAVNADRAFQAGTLMSTVENRPLDFVNNLDAKGLGIGALVTGALAVLRAKLAWFPFHPLGYVLASSNFMRACWFIFLLAWAARMLLFRIGGARMIRRGLVPFCVGMFMACIASIVLFDAVGIIMRLQGVTDVYSALP